MYVALRMHVLFQPSTVIVLREAVQFYDLCSLRYTECFCSSQVQGLDFVSSLIVGRKKGDRKCTLDVPSPRPSPIAHHPPKRDR